MPDGKSLKLYGHKNWVIGGVQLDHLLIRLRYEDEAVIWLLQRKPILVLCAGHTPGNMPYLCEQVKVMISFRRCQRAYRQHHPAGQKALKSPMVYPVGSSDYLGAAYCSER
ncbi:MAG: hypothetical protein R2865_01945 [Deinococcales bacterium]